MIGLRHVFRAAVISAALTLNSGAALAEKDALLDHMAGQWVLQGTIAGSQTTHDINVDWVLGNEYVRLHEVSREKDSQGKPRYEAIVLVGYDQTKSRYVCFWFDVTGIASPNSGGAAQREGDTLPFIFKSSQGDFYTSFVYDSKHDTWQWRMDAEQNGALQPFARVTLSRR